MREVSDPSPNVFRARTNARASSPLTVCRPLSNLSPLRGSLTSSCKQISTPPIASVIRLKAAKSTTMKLSIVNPLSDSTAFNTHPGPPLTMASLKRPS